MIKRKVGRPEKPVISDRGELYPSGVKASAAMGRSRSAVGVAINAYGDRCAGRYWRHATEQEIKKGGPK